MSTERDTKFLGFAKLLSDEIQDALRVASDTENLFELEHKIIAQRAYDLALHIVDAVRETTLPESIVSDIPDLTEWPIMR